MAEPIILIITAGATRSEKRVEISPLDSYTIGRGTDTALFLNDSGISRIHCRLFLSDGRILIEDTKSTSGTWLNGERLMAPAPLRDGDEVHIGAVKIEIRMEAERAAAAAQATMATPAPSGRQSPTPHRKRIPTNPDATLVAPAHSGSNQDGFSLDAMSTSAGDPPTQDHIRVSLNCESMVIGRDSSCDLPLNSLMISRRHTRIRRIGDDFTAEDLGSTNGTYLNDERLIGRCRLVTGDSLKIGPYNLKFDGFRLVSERPEMGAEITIRNLSKRVTDRETGQPKMLLRDISFTIRPRHFVGLLGTSGAGKSTFLGAVSGRRPASHGEVLLNGEDLYARFDSLKASVGFVPQDVIFHDSLPLIEALRYTSRLRLSKDASDEEIEANLDRVLKTVGLSESRSTLIKNLSGGQKKRVSIAMELLSQPRILFLDEVTSGLDPHTEKQMMKLFRELADSGITVICITHHANSVEICDEIVYLNKGLLTFYGSPGQFKSYFGVDQIEAAYEKEQQKQPAQWHSDFRRSEVYQQVIAAAEDSDEGQHTAERAVHNERDIDWPQFRRQIVVLTRRYVRVLCIDRRNLMLLLGLPPLTAGLLCILTSSMDSAPPIFNQSTYNVWVHQQNILCFGPIIILFLMSVFGSVREIVKELSIYEHERFINLRIIPYLLSKMGPLAVIAAIQTASVIAVINCFADMKAGNIIVQFVPLFLVSICGMLAGLAISASVKTSDKAVMLMIAVVIPQILFAGAMVPVRGASAFIAKGFISSYWALEALRFQVENYYLSHDLGLYSLTERSQPWVFCSFILLLHVLAFALLTLWLMARKDGPGAWNRIQQSLPLLLADLRERWSRRDDDDSLQRRASSGPRRENKTGHKSRAANYADIDSEDHPACDEVRARRRVSGGDNRIRSGLIGAIIGLLIGYPVSYFLQPGILRFKISLPDYIGHISEILQDSQLDGTVISTWIASIVLCCLIGLMFGARMSNRDNMR